MPYLVEKRDRDLFVLIDCGKDDYPNPWVVVTTFPELVGIERVNVLVVRDAFGEIASYFYNLKPPDVEMRFAATNRNGWYTLGCFGKSTTPDDFSWPDGWPNQSK